MCLCPSNFAGCLVLCPRADKNQLPMYKASNRVCLVYHVLLYFNFFSMFSASYFNQLERDKGHPKIERVHSTSFTIVFRSKNNNKDDNNNKKSH